MSLISYFVKNSSIRIAVYGIGIMSAFIVTPHVLHSMGSSVYGIWVLIAALQPYFTICYFASPSAISTLSAKASTTKNAHTMQQIFVASIQLGFLAIISTLLMALIYYFIASKEYTHYISVSAFALSLSIFALGFGIYFLLNIAHGFLAGHMRWNTLALTSMIRILSSSIGALLFLSPSYDADTNLIHMAYINVASFFIEACINFILAKRYFSLPPLQDLFKNPFQSELFQVSKSLSLIALGLLLHNSTQVYIIGATLSASVVTLFSLVLQLVKYSHDLILAAFGIMNPYFSKLHARNNTQESQSALLVSSFLCFNCTLIIVLGLIFYGELFFIRWIGPEYNDVQNLLVPMALASLFNVATIPITGYMYGLQKQKIIANLTLIEGIILTALSYPVLLLFGIEGLGWTLFISALFFKILWLPKYVCSTAQISVWRYHINTMWAIVPSSITQILYYFSIKDYVIAEYFSIFLAGFGQTIIACITLFVIIKLRAKNLW